MNPEVHGFAHSPYCIAVESALEALGVSFDRKEVSAADRSSVLRLTGGAYYEVPVLVHGGKVVFESGPESQDVGHYVDDAFGGGRLFPERLRGVHDLVIRYLENEVEGVTFRIYDPIFVASIQDVAERGMIVRHKERKFGRGCVEDWRKNRESLLRESARLLNPLEDMLSMKSYLFGDTPVFADFLLGGILGNLQFGDHQRLPADLPSLADFLPRLRNFRFSAA
ncbi:glutathione S-transferase family protein [Luteolibacter marinus]|uniref:glutathione S-transferase family protein n=1 Tax=Luteolibacter marinus TaxID=2776705 RepID=UPI001868CAC4|nr:glutathione S-transferase family protein [Luteolibacter marinus]